MPEETVKRLCPVCGQRVGKSTTRGRPRTYCGPACSHAAWVRRKEELREVRRTAVRAKNLSARAAGKMTLKIGKRGAKR